MGERWEANDVTPEDVTLIAGIYNDCIGLVYSPFSKSILKMGKILDDDKTRPDLIGLCRIIASLNCSPREYIMAQIQEYKKPIKKGRLTPTLKMMVSPSGIDRWNRHVEKKLGPGTHTGRIPCSFDWYTYSKDMMKKVMEANGIKSEKEYFMDPYLLSHLSRQFLMNNETFRALVDEGFYQKTFGMTVEEVLP